MQVQPAALEDGWDSNPWVLEERDGKLYGRGSTDDKVVFIEIASTYWDFCLCRDQSSAGSVLWLL